MKEFVINLRPLNIWIVDVHKYKNYFNMTMSYREDADIFIPHGKFHVTKMWLKDQVNTTIQNFAVKNRYIAEKSKVILILIHLLFHL